MNIKKLVVAAVSSVLAMASVSVEAHEVSKSEIRKVLRQEVRRHPKLRGPHGERGPRGGTGVTGPGGDRGEVGRRGPVGPPGIGGPVGAAGPVGAPGPRGPAGPDASGALYAHVFFDGTVDPERSRGITSENVARVQLGDDGDQGTIEFYCFFGLPPSLIGAQVTVDNRFRAGKVTPYLDFDVNDAVCQYAVVINDREGRKFPHDFYVLLY